jgi:hypothetical protein
MGQEQLAPETNPHATVVEVARPLRSEQQTVCNHAVNTLLPEREGTLRRMRPLSLRRNPNYLKNRRE